ncbi:hypothetical protein BpHYR1_003133 [Brachionus plicatilis]|uniref:Uncharacterized protein n=1 Tax=Brachionus plicatilis TaxID=10195 RepID=A0A3M7QAA4_BRAPC|nr:hypothetical protein BpHYR1_003133 [Brachionus plicatilis]
MAFFWYMSYSFCNGRGFRPLKKSVFVCLSPRTLLTFVPLVLITEGLVYYTSLPTEDYDFRGFVNLTKNLKEERGLKKIKKVKVFDALFSLSLLLTEQLLNNDLCAKLAFKIKSQPLQHISCREHEHFAIRQIKIKFLG